MLYSNERHSIVSASIVTLFMSLSPSCALFCSNIDFINIHKHTSYIRYFISKIVLHTNIVLMIIKYSFTW